MAANKRRLEAMERLRKAEPDKEWRILMSFLSTLDNETLRNIADDNFDEDAFDKALKEYEQQQH